MSASPPRPWVLIAELTHLCPLRCAYCSNPKQLVRREAELGTQAWLRAFEQACALGVLQLHLTGGEPLLRPDLEELARGASELGLFTTLVTSGLGARRPAPIERLQPLAQAGVRAVQVSFQDADGACGRAVAGKDAHVEKLAFARAVVAAKLSLTVNVVLHRQNVHRVREVVELALELGADRLELAHVQYHGWAELNRQQLLPDVGSVEHAAQLVREAKARHEARLDIVHVMPDYFSGRPKPCMGGWGQRSFVIDPAGYVLPCHAARSLPLSHERTPERSLAEIWHAGAAFEAFRGESWMEEPCKSCPERARDFGGCRCQALALAGRATATDPACEHSPQHERLLALTGSVRPAGGPGPTPRYLLRQHGAA
jgi:pyrroloquinoline quinone biosynthesis protein E